MMCVYFIYVLLLLPAYHPFTPLLPSSHFKLTFLECYSCSVYYQKLPVSFIKKNSKQQQIFLQYLCQKLSTPTHTKHASVLASVNRYGDAKVTTTTATATMCCAPGGCVKFPSHFLSKSWKKQCKCVHLFNDLLGHAKFVQFSQKFAMNSESKIS